MAEEFEGSADLLIADVGCIGAGEPICKKHGIKSFPTIRTFQPKTFMQGFSGLEYKGGKGIDSLRLHANNLVPNTAMNMEAVKAAAAAEAAKAARARASVQNKAWLAKVIALVAGLWVMYRLAAPT